jgi:hypothetical protein
MGGSAKRTAETARFATTHASEMSCIESRPTCQLDGQAGAIQRLKESTSFLKKRSKKLLIL